MKTMTTILGAIALAAGTATAGPLNDFNLLTAGNYDAQASAHTHGRVAVGGNKSGFAEIGQMLNPRGDYTGVDTFIVGGNTSGTSRVFAGNTRVGGANFGSLENHGPSATSATGVAGTAGYVSSMVSEVRSLATSLSGMASTAAFTASGNQASFNAAGQTGTVVFDVTADIFSSGVFAQFSLTNASAADAIVINVDASGTAGDVRFNTNMNGGMFGALADKIVWNFESADDIVVEREMFGSMIALDATLTNPNSNLNGSVAVGNFIQRGELHGPGFTPNLLTVVPMPAAGAMAGLGLGCLATRRRR